MFEMYPGDNIPSPQTNATGTSMLKKVGLTALVFGLVVSLALGGFLFMQLRAAEGDITSLQSQVGSIYDGELDYSTTLVDGATTELLRQSIRDAVFRYADTEGNYLGSAMVTAIIVSDEYVLVPAGVFPAPESGVVIVVGGMFASSLDPETGVETFDLTEQPLIDNATGFAAVRRPADTVIDAVPLLTALGDVREVDIDTVLATAGTVGLNTQAPNETGRQVTMTGKVDFVAGSRIGAIGLPSFQPVYVLRDGTPELIGVSIGNGGGALTPVVTIYELQPLLAQLGITVTFPE